MVSKWDDYHLTSDDDLTRHIARLRGWVWEAEKKSKGWIHVKVTSPEGSVYKQAARNQQDAWRVIMDAVPGFAVDLNAAIRLLRELNRRGDGYLYWLGHWPNDAAIVAKLMTGEKEYKPVEFSTYAPNEARAICIAWLRWYVEDENG